MKLLQESIDGYQAISWRKVVFRIWFASRLIIFSTIFSKLSCKPACWLSGNAFVFGERSLTFKSQDGQIGHSVANDLPPLQHFFERSRVARVQ